MLASEATQAKSQAAGGTGFLGEHKPVPLKFDPKSLKGLSEKLLMSHWENNYQHGNFFRDKIVLIGPAANIMQDFHLVPLARVELDEKTGEKVSDQSMPGDFVPVSSVTS